MGFFDRFKKKEYAMQDNKQEEKVEVPDKTEIVDAELEEYQLKSRSNDGSQVALMLVQYERGCQKDNCIIKLPMEQISLKHYVAQDNKFKMNGVEVYSDTGDVRIADHSELGKKHVTALFVNDQYYDISTPCEVKVYGGFLKGIIKSEMKFTGQPRAISALANDSLISKKTLDGKVSIIEVSSKDMAAKLKEIVVDESRSILYALGKTEESVLKYDELREEIKLRLRESVPISNRGIFVDNIYLLFDQTELDKLGDRYAQFKVSAAQARMDFMELEAQRKNAVEKRNAFTMDDDSAL